MPDWLIVCGCRDVCFCGKKCGGGVADRGVSDHVTNIINILESLPSGLVLFELRQQIRISRFRESFNYHFN
jgi:hypothetical protein